VGKIKILFIPLMLFFSILIVYGLYSGFSHTAEITKANLESETTSSVLTTIKTTTSTIRHTTIESTTTTTSSTSTTSTVQPGDPECEELGCPYGTNFVGSKNSDKYHYCSCSYAKSINRTNLVCFNNTEEAEEKGYIQSSCQPSTTTTSSTSTTSSTVVSTTTQGTTSSTTTTINIPELSLNVIAEKDPIARGNIQIIIIKVTDGLNPIENTLVNVTVTYASGTTKKYFGGFTNSTGIFNCSWQIWWTSNPGIFIVNSTANKEGYGLGTGSTTFNVTES